MVNELKKKKFDALPGLPTVGSDMAGSPWGASSFNAQNAFLSAQSAATPALASSVASMAKQYPNASAGTILSLSKMGIDPRSQAALDVINMDVMSKSELERQKARQLTTQMKQSAKPDPSSPVDFLAPVTRGFFITLSMPFQLIDGLVRNAFQSGQDINPIMQTELGQIGASLFRGEGINVGDGFLGVGQDTKIGQKLLEAKMAASDPGSKKVWNPAVGLTQALFDDPDTKAARTFEGISSFIWAIGSDPITWIPGVGLVNLTKASKLKSVSGATTTIRGQAKTGKAIDDEMDSISSEISELEDALSEIKAIQEPYEVNELLGLEDALTLERTKAAAAEAEFSVLNQRIIDAEAIAKETSERVTKELEEANIDPFRFFLNTSVEMVEETRTWLSSQDAWTRYSLDKRDLKLLNKEVDDLLEQTPSVSWGSRYYRGISAQDGNLYTNEGLVRESWLMEKLGLRYPRPAERKRGRYIGSQKPIYKYVNKKEAGESLGPDYDPQIVTLLWNLEDGPGVLGLRAENEFIDVATRLPEELGPRVKRGGKWYIQFPHFTRNEAREQIAKNDIYQAEDRTGKSWEELQSPQLIFGSVPKTFMQTELKERFATIGIDIPNSVLRSRKDETSWDIYKRLESWLEANADILVNDVKLAVINNPEVIQTSNLVKELFGQSYETLKAGEKAYKEVEDLKELVAVQKQIVADTNKTILSKEGRRNTLQKSAEEAIQKRIGYEKVLDESVLDYNKLQEFLFGKLGESVMRTLVAIKDPVKIRLASNHKFSVELSQELAAATTKEEVLQAISKTVGLRSGIDAKLGLGTRARLAAAGRAFELRPGYYDPKSVQLVRSQLNAFVNNAYVASGISAIADSKAARFLPTTGTIHIDDVNKLVEEMDNGLVYFNRFKDKVKREPVINQAMREKILYRIMNAPNSTARFRAWMDGIADIEIALIKSAGITVDSKRAALIKDAARIFGDVDTYRNFLAQASGDFGSTSAYKMLNGGTEVPILPNLPLIDSQLSNAVRMPQVREMRAIASKIGGILELNASAKVTRDLVNDLFNKRFKEFVLVGRISYIFRNVMDMQVRMYLSGNSTMFNSPLGFLSSVIADPKGGPIRKMMANAGRYQKDVFGDNWDEIAKTLEATNPEAIMSGAVSEYAMLMARQYSTGTGAAQRGLPAGIRLVKPGERSFNRAWSNALLMYRSGLLSKIAAGGLLGGYRKSNGNFVPYFKGADKWIESRKAQGLASNPEDVNVMVDFLYETAEGNKIRDLIANITPKYNFLSIDSPSTRDAMKSYIGTVQKEIDGLTGGNQNLVKFIAGEDLILPNGVPVSINPKALTSGNTPQKVVADALAKYRLSDDFESVVGIMRPLPDFTEAAAGRGYVEAWNKAVREFFRFSAQVEKTTSLGPEYQHQYWLRIAERFTFLNKAEGQKVLAQAEQSLSSFRINGKPVLIHPAVRSMRKEVNKLPDKGGLSLDDIHDGASAKAADYVAGLFYDASKAKQWAASLGIASPFIQAFTNTIALWSKLAVTNPVRTYKALNLYEWLESPESGWVYQWTNENAYDPGQGFIFDDPQFGEKRFVMPIVGDLISSVIGLIPGAPSVPKMVPTASVSGLNLAFQNELLPGVGPAVSLSLGPLVKDNDTWLAEQARRIIYPFGADAAATGPVSAFTPAWLQRVLNSFNPEWFKTKSQSTLKPIMGYLASTGNYGDLPLSDEMQEKLIRDANSINRVLSFWRGVTQNIAPTSIRPEILSKDKDGEMHVQFHIFNRFNQILAENPDDFSGSIAKVVDEYGPNTIFALVNNTRGGVTPTSDAWEFFRSNRDVANKYPDVFALFFPGGEYSAEFARWQERRGTRYRLTDSQINIEASRYLYNARKARLEEIEAFLIKEGADPKLARENYQRSIEELDAEFGGKPELRGVGLSTEQLLNSILNAAKDPVLAQTQAGKGLNKFLAYRELAFQETEMRGLKPGGFFQAKRAADVAEWLRFKAYGVIQEYPEFQSIYWRIFDRETEQD